MAFDLGGQVKGSSESVATQSAVVQFIPSVTNNEVSQPIVSPYPAGQGLASINNALPASAAWGASVTSSGVASSASWLVLLAVAAAGAAWFYFRHHRRG